MSRRQGRRVGRWTVIATLESGQTLTKQNIPPLPKRTAEEAREHRSFAVRSRKREMQDRDFQETARQVRNVLGLSIR